MLYTVQLQYVMLAGMAELVDAPDSKSGNREVVGVRFSLPAPHHTSSPLLALFLLPYTDKYPRRIQVYTRVVTFEHHY